MGTMRFLTLTLCVGMMSATGLAETNTWRFTLPDAEFPLEYAYVTDPAGNPWLSRIEKSAGAVVIESTQLQRIALHLLMEAGDAGTLMVTADNGGLGYEPRPEPYNLLEELYYCASGRRRPFGSARAAVEQLGRVLVSREDRVLHDAQLALRQRKKERHTITLTENGAPLPRQRVRYVQETTDTLIGQIPNWWWNEPRTRALVGDLYDYVTLPFNMRDLRPERDRFAWAERDAMVDIYRAQNIEDFKGHPLIWFSEGFEPPWFREIQWPELRKVVYDHVYEVVERYKGRVDRWDVTNEMNGWANSHNLSPDQLLKITVIASQAAKDANPYCEVVVNTCLPWGEYIQHWGKRRELPPHEYFLRLQRMECPFDVMGIQLYNAYASPFPHRDLYTISEMLDRYAALGKDIHVTEIAFPSAGDEYGVWRADRWTPELQAEFSRAFYEVCAAKPYVKAITWWGTKDVPDSDWDHVGMMDADYQPKPVLGVLQELKQSWLREGAGVTDASGQLTFTGMPGRYRLEWEKEGETVVRRVTVGE